MKNTDFDSFVKSLNGYFSEKGDFFYFIEQIKDLQCQDFRFYYYMAYYFNGQNEMNQAKEYIDHSLNQLQQIEPVDVERLYDKEYSLENKNMLWIAHGNSYILVEINPIKEQMADVYNLAGEIYAKMDNFSKSKRFYQKGNYYLSFLKSEFENQNSVTLFSFRNFNEYTLSDLINDEITVSPSTTMNDPFDSLINLWGDEDRLRKTCKEPKHIKPLHESLHSYRIRSFSSGTGNTPIQNILMWSHYAGEHSGFCIKYKLSQHFIHQEENDLYEHMYLKKIEYKNKKVTLYNPTIDSTLGFATKMWQWRYEKEVRLIVYNPNKEASHYGISLDILSRIDSIFFGYRCPAHQIETIRNIFKMKKGAYPNFYKIDLNPENVYRLQYHRI